MKRQIALPIYFIIAAVLIEVANFLILGVGVFPSYFFYNFLIIFCIGMIIFFISNGIAQSIVTGLILFAQILLVYVNYSLAIQFGDILTIEMINLILEVRHSLTSDFLPLTILFICIALAVVVITGLVLVTVKCKGKIIWKQKASYFIIALLLITNIVSIGGVGSYQSYIRTETDTTQYIGSDSFLLDTTILKLESMKTFGTYGFYVNNITQSLSHTVNESVYTALDDYMSNSDLATQSSVFGEAEGDNVIMIMLESIDNFAISEELTPNIYSLIDDGGQSSSYISKNKTNISESNSILGSTPVSSTIANLAGSDYEDNGQFDFSLPNILNEQGYTTSYFHSYLGSFYDREYTQSNLGYQNTYFFEDLFPEVGSDYDFFDWYSEEAYITAALDYFIPYDTESDSNDPFFSFYTTLSSHGSYETNENNQDQQYVDIVLASDYYNDMIESTPSITSDGQRYLANYLSAVIATDNVIGIIIDDLKEKGIYDNTTIILFGDHNAYYHNLTYMVKDVTVTEIYDFDINNVAFVIKSGTDLDSQIIDSPNMFSSVDITPTVLDLLGIESYDNMYLGDSIYNLLDSYVERVTYSHTGGILGKNYYTANLKDVYNYNMELMDLTTNEDAALFLSTAIDMVENLNYLNIMYHYELYPYLSINPNSQSFS